MTVAALEAARRTTTVVALEALPAWASTALIQARAPVLVALVSVSVAFALALAAAVDLAAALWPETPIAIVLLVGAVPIARSIVGGPGAIARSIERSAPLLTALELGGPRLARHRVAALALPVVAPTALLALAASAAFGVRGQTTDMLWVLGAASMGVACAVLLSRLRTRAREQRAGRAAAAGVLVRGGLVVACGLGIALVAPVARPALAELVAAWGSAGRPIEGRALVLAAALALTAWLGSEILVADARPALRFARALTGVGLRPLRMVTAVAAAALLVAGAVGGALAFGAWSLLRDGTSASLVFGVVSCTLLLVVAAIAVEPSPRRGPERMAAAGLAMLPGAVVVAGGSPLVLTTAAVVLPVATVVLHRRLA